MRFVFKCLFVVAAIFVVAACSTKSKNVNMPGESGTYAQGVGVESDVMGSNKMDKNKGIGGENQVVYFDFDNTTIHNEYQALLATQAHYLTQHRSAKIRLEGHTDARGSREYNIGLGDRRARSVANALMALGVSQNQIKIVSYGKEKPAVLGDNEEAYKMNRRVELIYEAY